MKTFLLVFSGLIFSSSCAVQADLKSNESVVVNKEKPQNFASNQTFANQKFDGVSVQLASSRPLSTKENAAVDEQKQNGEQEAEQNNKNIAEFANVDFANFVYPVKFRKKGIELRNGSFNYENLRECDFRSFEFLETYFIDLIGDEKNEVIVRLGEVDCGCGSCDGGSNLFYLYSSGESKPKLLRNFETGSLAYGGGLRSFVIKNKQIIIEQFGENGTTKFNVKDIRRSIFEFRGRKVVRVSEETIFMPERSVLNYQAEIKIEQ